MEEKAYLKCNICGEMLGGVVIEFDSVYIGYDFGSCLVDKEHIKQQDKSGLVKVIGGVGKNDNRHKTPDSREYVYIK